MQRAAACENIRAAPPIYVAFNPYFPSKAAAAEERKRLTRKLDTGLVKGIYLQMGTDMEQLKQGLDFLKDASRNQHGNHMDLFGSVFLPTKRCTSYLMNYTFRTSQFCRDGQQLLCDVGDTMLSKELDFWSVVTSMFMLSIMQVAGPNALPPMEWGVSQ